KRSVRRTELCPQTPPAAPPTQRSELTLILPSRDPRFAAQEYEIYPCWTGASTRLPASVDTPARRRYPPAAHGSGARSPACFSEIDRPESMRFRARAACAALALGALLPAAALAQSPDAYVLPFGMFRLGVEGVHASHSSRFDADGNRVELGSD